MTLTIVWKKGRKVKRKKKINGKVLDQPSKFSFFIFLHSIKKIFFNLSVVDLQYHVSFSSLATQEVPNSLRVY